MKLYPMHVAYRGFGHSLLVDHICRYIMRGVDDHVVTESPFVLWPSGEPLPTKFRKELVQDWKHQYDEGMRIEVPEELWPRIDACLSFHDPGGTQRP